MPWGKRRGQKYRQVNDALAGFKVKLGSPMFLKYALRDNPPTIAFSQFLLTWHWYLLCYLVRVVKGQGTEIEKTKTNLNNVPHTR